MTHKSPDPADHTSFHIYLADRLETLQRYVYLLMGLCGADIITHLVDGPLFHL